MKYILFLFPALILADLDCPMVYNGLTLTLKTHDYQFCKKLIFDRDLNGSIILFDLDKNISCCYLVGL